MTEQPIDILQPDPHNPRRISTEALTGLGVSMEAFGDIATIVWNERTGRLVAGHQRMGQLRAAGVTAWQRNGKRGEIVHPKTGERFAVRIVDWDETTERAANLTANNPEIAGEYTPEALAQLKAIDDDVDYAGLRLDALQATLEAAMPVTPAEGKTDPDAVPEVPKTPVTKPGDLWVLGEHRLLCGDSTKAEDVARLMGGERAGLMNTDPPYGVAYANDDRPNPGVAKPRVANDTLKGAKLQTFLEAVFVGATLHALKKNAAWYLWHAHLTQGFFAAAAAAAAANVVLHRQIIWVKPVLLLGRGQYHWKHEPCFMGWVDGHQPPDYGLGNGERTQTTIWEIDSVTHAERKEFDHSTPKPVGLFTGPIVKHLKRGEIAYEPFVGSGPQYIAAEQHQRRCFGIEIEPRFCDVAVTRWENFTGRKATRETAPRAPKPKRTKPRRK
jgi:DNA modification methylase